MSGLSVGEFRPELGGLPQFGNVNGVQVPRGCLFGALKGLILYSFGFKFGMQLEYSKQD